MGVNVSLARRFPSKTPAAHNGIELNSGQLFAICSQMFVVQFSFDIIELKLDGRMHVLSLYVQSTTVQCNSLHTYSTYHADLGQVTRNEELLCLISTLQ